MAHTDITSYNRSQADAYKHICELLAAELSKGLPAAESKIWHGHPVWFLNGNPIVGYSLQKPGVRLIFWSGADFGEPNLLPGSGKFKDASVFYNTADEINTEDLKRWLQKSEQIQWDYKNIVKHNGVLERLK